MPNIHIFPTIACISSALLLPLLASADTLTGHVEGVTDGDTITLLDASTVAPWDYRKRNKGE